jgi:quercetin dioxygenase-like cupin family protein
MNAEDVSKGVIFSRGEPMPEPISQNFTGKVYRNMLVPADSPLGYLIAYVTFEPGSRTNWHRHPGGQILLVMGGRGWYQEEDKPPRELNAGDVVEIPRNAKHWHGAAKESWFAHIALEVDLRAGQAEWLEPVADQDYEQLS